MGVSDSIKAKKTEYVVTTSDSTKVSSTNTPINIPIGGNAAMEEGYGDKLNTKKNNQVKSIEEVYNIICQEVQIDTEEAKSFNLLEKILGCSSEELVQRYNEKPENFNLIIECIKDAADTFWPWSEKSLEEIANDANEAFISKMTGGSKLGQWWFNLTKSGSLIEELGLNESSTLEEKRSSLKSHFVKEYLGDMSKLSNEEKGERYQQSLNVFGKFLNKYKTAEEKALLASVIEDLQADKRSLAVELTLASCMNETQAVQIVAVAVEENREAIVSKADALGEIMSQEDATSIAHSTFSKMSEEDIEVSLSKMQARGMEVNARLKELLAKKEAGTLTEAEKQELVQLESVKSNYVVSGYSGATTGLVYNSDCSKDSKESFYSQIVSDTKKLNISKEVLANVNQYINKHPEISKDSAGLINKVVEQISNNIDEATNQNSTDNNSKPEGKSEGKTPVEKAVSTTKSEADKIVNVKINTPNTTTKGTLGFSTRALPEDKMQQYITSPFVDTNKPLAKDNEEDSVATLAEAFNKGYKAYKEYIQNTNDSEVSYLIKTLNNCKNPEIIRNVLASLENYDDSFLGMLAENTKNNKIKIELGLHINNIEVLNKVLKSSNNNSIRDFYTERIDELKEKEQKNNCA